VRGEGVLSCKFSVLSLRKKAMVRKPGRQEEQRERKITQTRRERRGSQAGRKQEAQQLLGGEGTSRPTLTNPGSGTQIYLVG
jgi:hypothetical protein